MVTKCSAQPGGYAATTCETIGKVVENFPTKRSKGFYSHSMVNISTGVKLGTMIKLKQGEYLSDGVVLNFCPFCGGELRDSSND